MHSVTARICALEFSATITPTGEWLHANQYEPIRYKYEDHEDAVLVTVDFTGEGAAEAFATRFEGVCRLSP
jgi:hypothetical protein